MPDSTIIPHYPTKTPVKKFIRHLLDTQNKGTLFEPELCKGVECYVDPNLSCRWKDDDHVAPKSVLSRTCYVIIYAGCLITQGSSIQTEIALSILQLRVNNLHCQLLCVKQPRSVGR